MTGTETRRFDFGQQRRVEACARCRRGRGRSRAVRPRRGGRPPRPRRGRRCPYRRGRRAPGPSSRRPCGGHRRRRPTLAEPSSRPWLPSSGGSATAAELTVTLSAPASSSVRASATRADPAADGEGDVHGVGDAGGQLGRGLPPVGGRRDVEEHQFVGPFVAIAAGQLDRIAGVAEVLEVRSLHDPPLCHIQAGNDANRQPAIAAASPPAVQALGLCAQARASGFQRQRARSSRRRPTTTASQPAASKRANIRRALRTPPLAVIRSSGKRRPFGIESHVGPAPPCRRGRYRS